MRRYRITQESLGHVPDAEGWDARHMVLSNFPPGHVIVLWERADWQRWPPDAHRRRHKQQPRARAEK